MMVFSTLFLFIAIHAVSSSDQVSEDDLSELASANNYLAGTLYPKLIKGNSDNIFFVPLSLMTGLGIMLYGAKGKTQQELYSVLGYQEAGLPIDKIPRTYHYYLSEMLPQNNPNFTYYTLLCADEVLVTKKAPLHTKFKKEAEHLYSSKIQNIDFSKTARTTRIINHFVNQHTYRKIHYIVNDVSAMSSALLVDAVFFKGMWETPFPPYWSGPQTFNSPKGKKDVPFMLVVHSFPYYQNDEYQAIFLPYVGGFLGLLVILPQDRNGLEGLEAAMTPDNILNLLNQLQPRKTIVLLPKFKFQYHRDFSNDFRELGAESAYNGATADFSGMSDGKNLTVSRTLYKGALEVDEANQGVDMSVDFTPPISAFFMANSPFMFAVVDIRYDLLVAMGRVIEV